MSGGTAVVVGDTDGVAVVVDSTALEVGNVLPMVIINIIPLVVEGVTLRAGVLVELVIVSLSPP